MPKLNDLNRQLHNANYQITPFEHFLFIVSSNSQNDDKSHFAYITVGCCYKTTAFTTLKHQVTLLSVWKCKEHGIIMVNRSGKLRIQD